MTVFNCIASVERRGHMEIEGWLHVVSTEMCVREWSWGMSESAGWWETGFARAGVDLELEFVSNSKFCECMLPRDWLCGRHGDGSIGGVY
jgi:hypothetical protein